jgi:diguanylate cyclase (GGDEF)-like protein
MKVPGHPENEATRIQALHALNVLDTDLEERFDRLTRLARRLFNVPIALVTLVDVNRQWFKSRMGLNICETSRDISFCGHAILVNDILIVEDALLDERFYDNPLVLNEPKIRFYAGIPLTASNDSKLGTLCLIDHNPRTLNEEDQSLLRDLARMVEQELVAVQLAMMDELTLLSNRRGFIMLASHALNLCKRLCKPVILFFFDLDSFKQINDQYGHAEGDRALTSFSQVLKEAFRESDVVGRLGGDEFVALLSNADLAQSKQSLHRLDRLLEAHNEREARDYSIRFSVGTIEFDPNQHQSIEDLLKAADALMYRQKQERHRQ